MSSSDTRSPTPAHRIPIAVAALDTTGTTVFAGGVEIVLVPLHASSPLGLKGEGARVWRRLISEPPVPTTSLSATDLQIVDDLEHMELVSPLSSHPSRVRTLRRPVLSSPSHELVYAVVANVAREHGIRCVFVKGPALHRQGIRDRDHSGDVDVWCDPRRWEDLIVALEPYGWRREPDPWFGTPVNHSATLVPGDWGCEIDVHRRIPGMTLDDLAAFDAVLSDTVTEIHAGVPVVFPAPAPHAVIAALHAARPEIGRGPRTARSIEASADLLRRAPQSLEAVRRLGAFPALEAEIELLAPAGTVAPLPGGSPRDWAWRSESSRVRAYFSALREQRPTARMRLLLRLLWPPADVTIESARRAGEPTDDVLRARLRRLVRGIGEWVRSSRRGG